jgi:hypothetical protein
MSAKLSIEQLRREHCYFVLSVKQQKMVEVYLGTGDKVKAVQAAFKCASEKTARVMTYSYFAKPGVIACLAVAFGDDPRRETFKAEVRRAMKNKKLTYPQAAALKLYGQLHGFAPSSLPTAEPAADNETLQTFPIGSVIVQDGKKYRVVAQEIDNGI